MSRCCPQTYWCTTDGIVGVEPGDDGYYATPANATGGPYATWDEAWEACPPEPISYTCNGQTLNVPSAVALRIDNLTGSLVGRFDFDTIIVPVGPNVFGGLSGEVDFLDNFGWQWRAGAGFACGCDTDNQISVGVSFGRTFLSPCYFPANAVGYNGWTPSTVPGAENANGSICRDFGTLLIRNERVARITYECSTNPAFLGSLDLYTV